MREVDYAHSFLKKLGSLSFTLWYNTHLWSHSLCFLHIFNKTKSLHKFLSQSQCELSIAIFICKVLEQHELLPTFTSITWKCYIFGLICHIWDPKTIIKSIYLLHKAEDHTQKLTSVPQRYTTLCVSIPYSLTS